MSEKERGRRIVACWGPFLCIVGHQFRALLAGADQGLEDVVRVSSECFSRAGSKLVWAYNFILIPRLQVGVDSKLSVCWMT